MYLYNDVLIISKVNNYLIILKTERIKHIVLLLSFSRLKKTIKLTRKLFVFKT